MHRDAYTDVIILIVGYISEEFIFKEKRLNEISENKFSSKITRYTVQTSLLLCLRKVFQENKLRLYYHSVSLYLLLMSELKA